MIKVSVIIPVYNAADTIERCVDSILQIQRDDVEVVLVEDCSSDNSLSVCNMLDEKYSNVRCLFNDQNRGVSYTRNKGVRNANGRYIMFVDSDDWVDPDYLDTFIDLACEKEELFAVCGYVNHDEKKNARTEIFAWEGFEGVRKQSLDSVLKQLYDKRLLQQLWNKIFVTDWIKKNEIFFDESISIGEDLRFILEYIRKCNITEIYLINRPLYHYMRDQKGALMYRVGYEGVEEPLKNLRELYRILGKTDEEIEQILIAERQRQLEVYAYLIFHNYGMKRSEKKRLILALDEKQGKTLYKKNRCVFLKERILILRDCLFKQERKDEKRKS